MTFLHMAPPRTFLHNGPSKKKFLVPPFCMIDQHPNVDPSTNYIPLLSQENLLGNYSIILLQV